MKTRIVGSRAYTKSEITTYDGGEFAEARRNNPHLGTIQEKINVCVEMAHEVLSNPELPQYRPIFILNQTTYDECPLSQECPYEDGCTAVPCRYEYSDDLVICDGVESYIKHKSTDEKMDSPDMLAVMMLDYVRFIRKKLEKGSIESACHGSFALGVKFQQLKTVCRHISKTSESASKSRVKVWASLLAEYLIKQYPNETKIALINRIPDSESALHLEGYEVYLDGTVVVGLRDKDGFEDTLKVDSFRTGYLSKL